METIKPYSKQIERFSDDSVYFAGAYGPKVVEQLTYVVNQIHADLHTRQAVINIWRERPAQSKDIPCTLSLQFLTRDGRLNCVATMRSSDIWLGWVYDIFNFSMISAYIRELLIQRDPDKWNHLVLGELTLTAGSQHLYDSEWDKAQAIVDEHKVIEGDNWSPEDDLYPGVPEVEKTKTIVSYLEFMKDYGDNHQYLQGGGFLDGLFETVYFRKGVG